MLSFKSFRSPVISEGFAPESLNKAAVIIRKYLKKTTSLAMFMYPGIEEFNTGGAKGWGLRYYMPKKNASVRFNFGSISQIGLTSVESITYWNGKESKPYLIKFDSNVSIVKTLPLVADIIKNGIPSGTIYTIPDDVPLNESYLNEDTYVINEAKFGMEEIFDGVLNLIQSPTFAKGKVHSMYKGAGFKIFDELELRYPNLITKSGTKYVWSGKGKDVIQITKARTEILSSIGAVAATVTRGKTAESYKADPGIQPMEDNMERLTFEVQLEDLEKLLKMTISGTSNALFIAGKGGVGKTHTTEKVLQTMGLRDGQGYFKNTGSASAAGIYSLLFKYKNDIILFDDSDGALADQDARNIIKAATDDKKVRKLVWNKMGKNIVDPDEMSDDDILANGLIPRHFEFTGRIIFISNLSLNKLDPDGALRTRAYIVNIDPTDMEIYDFMTKIVDTMPLAEGLTLNSAARRRVVDLLRKSYSKEAPNLRKLSRGLNMAAGAEAGGDTISDDELRRLIQTYA